MVFPAHPEDTVSSIPSKMEEVRRPFRFCSPRFCFRAPVLCIARVNPRAKLTPPPPAYQEMDLLIVQPLLGYFRRRPFSCFVLQLLRGFAEKQKARKISKQTKKKKGITICVSCFPGAEEAHLSRTAAGRFCSWEPFVISEDPRSLFCARLPFWNVM